MLKPVLRRIRQSLVLTLLALTGVAAGVQACCGSDGYVAPE